MPYGKIPVLEIDGVKHSNTLAVCAYLGKKFNLAGSNDLEALQIHSAAAFVYDLIDSEWKHTRLFFIFKRQQMN
jgi:glutathione S-transferase